MVAFWNKVVVPLSLLLLTTGHVHGALYAHPYVLHASYFGGEDRHTIWAKILAPLQGRPHLRYLEIGVCEGGSLLWMLENVLTHPTARATGVDIFPGDSEKIFRYNLKLSGFADKVAVMKGFSRDRLKELPKESFDVIYIDGSHMAKDVMRDAVLSWELLKIQGLLIFDDYQYNLDLPAQFRPRTAIDAFLDSYGPSLEVVYRGYQVVVKKIIDPCPEDKWWECSPVGPYLYERMGNRLYTHDGNSPVELSSDELRLIQKMALNKNWETLRSDPLFRSLNDRLQLEKK